jgi:hypothetical protein
MNDQHDHYMLLDKALAHLKVEGTIGAEDYGKLLNTIARTEERIAEARQENNTPTTK